MQDCIISSGRSSPINQKTKNRVRLILVLKLRYSSCSTVFFAASCRCAREGVFPPLAFGTIFYAILEKSRGIWGLVAGFPNSPLSLSDIQKCWTKYSNLRSQTNSVLYLMFLRDQKRSQTNRTNTLFQYDKKEEFALPQKNQFFWEVLRDIGICFCACPLLLNKMLRQRSWI